MSAQVETPSSSATVLSSRTEQLAKLLEPWLQSGQMAVACGRWQDGGVAEILPAAGLSLLPAVYDGCYVGVREIRLHEADHHVHLDLGRVHRLQFAMAPSVCFAFRPSFELRLLVLGPGDAPTDRWVVSLLLLDPYAGGHLRPERALWFLTLMVAQLRAAPQCCELWVEPGLDTASLGQQLAEMMAPLLQCPAPEAWQALHNLATGTTSLTESPLVEPTCMDLFRAALALRAASLVLFRDRLLVEFQTEQIAGVFRYEEGGHVSWQVGDFHSHHCHLSLSAVRRVLFSAEPVSCQGFRLNYTIWFLTDGPSGNPWRRDGYCSVVLNHPYEGPNPRLDHIDPVLALYRAHAHLPWVAADARFTEVLAKGPTGQAFVPMGTPCPA